MPGTNAARHVAIAVMLATALLAGCAATGPDRDRDGTGIPLQARRDWTFAQDGVRFDNRLPAARLHDVTRAGPRHYVVTITPERQPINPSPWYGFRVMAETAGPVRIDFSYPGFEHRYHPKLAAGDGRWREATPAEFTPERDGQPARLQVAVGAHGLRVFAQPPLLPEDFEAWTRTIAARVPIERNVFGHSVAGAPLWMFEFGGDARSPLLIVIGRQHPPENTGSQALQGFVETLAGDTPQARAFRGRVRTIVVPVVNPDGIVEGHWRGNLHGRDLNRDWGPFAEPETRALAQALLARSEAAGRPVLFALDFHSTHQDILYTVDADPARGADGVLGRWIAGMRTLTPALAERASPPASPVFKNWAYCRFGAASVTYEVGDATPADALDALSRHAAVTLMGLLDDPGLRGPAQDPACESAGPMPAHARPGPPAAAAAPGFR